MVSVIITVFNLQDYCWKSVESILKQTYKNIEIILVNDGSTDGSLDVLSEFKEKYPDIILIDKANGGVSSARNDGIEASSGEYICFMDGDDIAAPFMIEELVRHMDAGTGAVIGNQIRILSQDDWRYEKKDNIKSYSAEICIRKLLQGTFPVSTCAVMFRKADIGELRYATNIAANEDKLFLVKYIIKNNTLQFKRIESTVYGYCIRSGSATRKKWDGKFDRIRVSEMIRESVADVYPQFRQYAVNAQIAAILGTEKSIVLDADRANYGYLGLLRQEMIELGPPRNTRRQLELEYFLLKAGVPFYIVLVKLYYWILPEKKRFGRNENRIQM